MGVFITFAPHEILDEPFPGQITNKKSHQVAEEETRSSKRKIIIKSLNLLTRTPFSIGSCLLETFSQVFVARARNKDVCNCPYSIYCLPRELFEKAAIMENFKSWKRLRRNHGDKFNIHRNSVVSKFAEDRNLVCLLLRSFGNCHSNLIL